MSRGLEAYADADLDLEGLVAAAGALLGPAGLDQADGRVTALPDARGVRYYQTIGILSRPRDYVGRQARYGFRHLVELVCVKLLQAQGLSLAQVQAALAGASLPALVAAAEAGLGDRGAVAPARSVSGPAPPGRLPPPPRPPTWPLAGAGPDAAPAAAPGGARGLVAAEVAPGVVVTLDPEQVEEPEAVLARIRGALANRKEGAR